MIEKTNLSDGIRITRSKPMWNLEKLISSRPSP